MREFGIDMCSETAKCSCCDSRCLEQFEIGFVGSSLRIGLRLSAVGKGVSMGKWYGMNERFLADCFR